MLFDQARTENLVENVHILSRLVACSWVRNVSCLKQGAGRAGRWAGTSQTPNCSGRRASRYNLVCLATTGWYPASCITVHLRPELPLQTSQNFWFLGTHTKNYYTLMICDVICFVIIKLTYFVPKTYTCVAARIIRSDTWQTRFGMPHIF